MRCGSRPELGTNNRKFEDYLSYILIDREFNNCNEVVIGRSNTLNV